MPSFPVTAARFVFVGRSARESISARAIEGGERLESRSPHDAGRTPATTKARADAVHKERRAGPVE